MELEVNYVDKEDKEGQKVLKSLVDAAIASAKRDILEREADQERLTIGLSKYVILFIVLVTVGILLLLMSNFGLSLPSDSIEVWGQTGDFIGGVLNPFVAFGALMLLFVSISIQRMELKATRRELNKSAEALEKTVKHNEDVKQIESLKGFINLAVSDIERALRTTCVFIQPSTDKKCSATCRTHFDQWRDTDITTYHFALKGGPGGEFGEMSKLTILIERLGWALLKLNKLEADSEESFYAGYFKDRYEEIFWVANKLRQMPEEVKNYFAKISYPQSNAKNT